MSIYVFLGPTLPVAEARKVLDAVYLPPVTLGDVLSVVEEHQPKAIAIIDGLFDQEPSVWHKEILYALSKGVRVFGSSSMGAIRAAELSAFGMEGVGQIFQAFERGELEDDDEVAIAHGPTSEGSRPLSDPMVNIRAGLERAAERGLITASTRDALTTGFKQTFYAERRWNEARALGRALHIPTGQIDALLDYVRSESPDVKREDALTLLRTLRTHVDAGTLTPHVASFDFEPTYNWRKLMNISQNERKARAFRGAFGEPTLRRRLDDLKDRAPVRSALLLLLVSREAARLGVPALGSKERATRLEAFKTERGLKTDQELAAWRAENHVSVEELDQVLELAWAENVIHKRYGDDLEHFLKLELARSGSLKTLVQRGEPAAKTGQA